MQADQKKTLRRLRIIKGQVEGILRMVEEDRYCIDISNQIMAVIASLKGVNRDVLTAHLAHCVAEGFTSKEESVVAEKMTEIEQVITKLSK